MAKPSYEKAKSVLQALIQGVDPNTGDELADDTILNRADIMRTLLVSLHAVNAAMARDSRRAHLPPSVGKGWSEDEQEQLRDEFARQLDVRQIAIAHGRTVRAIEARLERLGLMPPEQRSTVNTFANRPNDRRKKE